MSSTKALDHDRRRPARAGRARLPRPPRGWPDLLRQVAIVVGSFLGYQLVSGLNSGRAAEAIANSRRIIDAERALHAFAAPAVQAPFTGHHLLMELANWVYVDGHFAVTSAVLLWIWLRRPRHFTCVRNAFVAAMTIALVVYALFPAAPPRWFPHLGIVDTLAVDSGIHLDHGPLQALVNPVAAVPSMHIAFSVLTAAAVIALTRRRAARAVAACYPPLLTFVVIVTGNHFWIDAVAGALVAVMAAAAARLALARLRPPWGWPALSAPADAATVRRPPRR